MLFASMVFDNDGPVEVVVIFLTSRTVDSPSEDYGITEYRVMPTRFALGSQL
ncbi:hypothetical protein [Protofrankia symbiont of Coriaria ruscifolia]|uniref:Secreted protein n=1 Tax=Candidatus Protofrankia californiensis TaxID=1839754 RepID=A0A1C3NT25_9ACTN|nr:hypothetical protein [Protofrankia symbiont of Coriaria ruscifolia]SBW17369.1 hypothetical protein FDG2_0187 [Candidatus Protofrankia californiensis]